jgi:hypothetical protein
MPRLSTEQKPELLGKALNGPEMLVLTFLLYYQVIAKTPNYGGACSTKAFVYQSTWTRC